MIAFYLLALPARSLPGKGPVATVITAGQFLGMARGVSPEGATLAEAALLLGALALAIYLGGVRRPELLRGAALLAAAGVMLLPLEVAVADLREDYLAGVASATQHLLPLLLLPGLIAAIYRATPALLSSSPRTGLAAHRLTELCSALAGVGVLALCIGAGRGSVNGLDITVSRYVLLAGQAPVALYLASLLLPSPTVRRMTQAASLAMLLVALPADWDYGADYARQQHEERAPLAAAVYARRPVPDVARAAAASARTSDTASLERIILRARAAGVEPWSHLPLGGGPGLPAAPAP